MGGQGSGRTPNVETLLRGPENKTPIAEELFIPNYSGLQPVKKTDPTIGSGTETDPVFLALSDSLSYVATESDPIFLALSNSLSYIATGTETEPVYLANSGSYLTSYTESDPVWLSQSGSYFLKTDETEPVYLANSGSYLTSYTESDPVFLAQSGSFLTAEADPIFLAMSDSLAYEPTLTKGDLEASGSGITIYNGTGAVIGTGTKISVEGAGDEADPVWLAQSGSYLKTANLAASETDPKFFSLSNSIATYMLMSLSHSAWYFPMSLSTSLAYIPLSLSSSWNTDLASGSAHFADSSDPHGATLTQTNIIGGHISGSAVSGSTIKVLADNDASGSAICRNILVGTEATPGPANLYTQGSVYLKYTA